LINIKRTPLEVEGFPIVMFNPLTTVVIMSKHGPECNTITHTRVLDIGKEGLDWVTSVLEKDHKRMRCIQNERTS